MKSKIQKRKEKLYHDMELLLTECSIDNWDKSGAKAINVESHTIALRFIEALPCDVVFPEPAVNNDGDVSFKWYKSPQLLFDVSIAPNGRLVYAGFFKGYKTSGIDFFEKEIPDVILCGIKRIYPESVASEHIEEKQTIIGPHFPYGYRVENQASQILLRLYEAETLIDIYMSISHAKSLVNHITSTISDYESITQNKVVPISQMVKMFLEKEKSQNVEGDLNDIKIKKRILFVPYDGFVTYSTPLAIFTTFRELSNALHIYLPYPVGADLTLSLKTHIAVCETANETTFKTLAQLNEAVEVINEITKEKTIIQMQEMENIRLNLADEIKKHIEKRESSEKQKE